MMPLKIFKKGSPNIRRDIEIAIFCCTNTFDFASKMFNLSRNRCMQIHWVYLFRIVEQISGIVIHEDLRKYKSLHPEYFVKDKRLKLLKEYERVLLEEGYL